MDRSSLSICSPVLSGFVLGAAFALCSVPCPAQDRELRESLNRDADRWELRARISRNVVKLVSPSVVHLESKSFKHLPFGEGATTKLRRIEETGSGVIVEIHGKSYVLTNRHIIAEVESDTIRIHLSDRRVLQPVRVLSSVEFDIALIEIATENLVPAKIRDSDTVQIGEEVYAFGSPFGLSGSVSAGIISAIGRRKIPRGGPSIPIQSFFQTDAAVNPGNSGGPLVDLRGEVIAIITAIASSGGGNEGVAFAIPINSLMRSAKQLVETGRVIRPYLGINLDPQYTWDDAERAGLDRNIGAMIEKIVQNSPGDKAGFREGDIIVSYNGTPVEDDKHLIVLIALSELGDEPEIEVLRNRTLKILKPKLIERK